MNAQNPLLVIAGDFSESADRAGQGHDHPEDLELQQGDRRPVLHQPDLAHFDFVLDVDERFRPEDDQSVQAHRHQSVPQLTRRQRALSGHEAVLMVSLILL